MTADERLKTALVQSICSTAMSGCIGPDSQYSNMSDCISTLGSKDLGEWYQLRGKPSSLNPPFSSFDNSFTV